MSRAPIARLARIRPYVCPECIARNRRAPQHARLLSTSSSTRQSQQNILSLLEERGFVNQIAGDRDVLAKLLSRRRLGFYAGIDPTAPSLHLGHLLPLMVLFWLYRHGHHVVSLVGGATAKVGDPSGRLTSRTATTELDMSANFQGMFAQVGQLWKNVEQYGQRNGWDEQGLGKQELLDNAQWLNGLGILPFLRTMGNGARLGAMLGRDTVKNKMEKGDGMSFSEFTYPLLQAWDWWQMYHDRQVQIQIGGSDQYGNIIAGIDAVKYIAQNQAGAGSQTAWLDREGKLQDDMSPMGLTVPLLTTSSGEKFGKSAGNAVWLDKSLTTPFDLYGFLLRSADADVERYLKLFTFLPSSRIRELIEEHSTNPGERKAQHTLASEVLELVHGPEEASKTRAEHQAMRAPTLDSLLKTEPSSSNESSTDTSSVSEHIRLPKSLVHNTTFARILYHAALATTKSEGARLVSKGGVYLALPADGDVDGGALRFTPIKDHQSLELEEALVNGLLVLRLGKWKVRIIEVVDDGDFDARGLDAPGWADWKASQ